MFSFQCHFFIFLIPFFLGLSPQLPSLLLIFNSCYIFLFLNPFSTFLQQIHYSHVWNIYIYIYNIIWKIQSSNFCTCFSIKTIGSIIAKDNAKKSNAEKTKTIVAWKKWNPWGGGGCLLVPFVPTFYPLFYTKTTNKKTRQGDWHIRESFFIIILVNMDFCFLEVASSFDPFLYTPI